MSVRPRLAVLAVFAAGGTAFGGYYLWPNGRHLAPCAPLHAPVPAAAQQTLVAYVGRIRHDVQRADAGQREETWYDSATGAQRQLSFDRRGTITDEFASVRHGKTVSSVWVQYRGRTWISHRDPTARLARPDAAAVVAQVYRDKVAHGRARVLGHQVVDGHETLKLHETLASRTFPQMQMETWVDRLTYVPVRTRTAVHGHWLQTDSAWLPRTAANVAKTRLVIPHGFRREFPSMHGFDKVLVTHIDTGRGCRQS